MDKEIKKAIEQPLEGLLYDLDLMPEQCKTFINELRSGVVECQYKEIEQLRKEKEWLVKQLGYEHVLDGNCKHLKDGEKIVYKRMQQALKESK